MTSWRHWHYYMTSRNLFPSSQPANVLECWFYFCFRNFWVAELSFVINIVVAWWNDVTKWRYDVIIQSVPISACRCAREIILVCYYSVLGCWVQKYHRFCIYLRVNVITWLHDVIIWLYYNVTKLTPSISACRWARQMIRYLHTCACFAFRVAYVIRKCHSTSICMMTLLHAVTS